MKKTYIISFGMGMYLVKEQVAVEEWQCEQDAVDLLIDQYESKGYEGYLLSNEEVMSGEYHKDCFIIGGNNGRALLHSGYITIEEEPYPVEVIT